MRARSVKAPSLMRTSAAFAVIVIVALAGCVSPTTRRIHAENMAKAETFKAMFDRDVKAGASFDQVLQYLKAHNLHFGPLALTLPQDEPPAGGSGRLEVEMFREKSLSWACGKASVGLNLSFVNNKLTDTSFGSWSLDCL
jgi:hypothetical protein